MASLDSIRKAFTLPYKEMMKDKTTALQLFDWKKINAGEPDIDCPPAAPKKKKSKMVKVE